MSWAVTIGKMMKGVGILLPILMIIMFIFSATEKPPLEGPTLVAFLIGSLKIMTLIILISLVIFFTGKRLTQHKANVGEADTGT